MEISSGKPLELSDKPIFDKYLNKFPPNISELTFSNLFIWKNYYDFLFLEWENHIIIYAINFFKNWGKSIAGNNDSIFFLPPIGLTPEKIILKLFKELENLEIHRVPEMVMKKLHTEKEFERLNLRVYEDRDNWDYVYEIKNMVNLPGNRYRQKRRWLNKFLELYNYDFHVISGDLIKKTLELQLEWCDVTECQGNEDLMEEQKAIETAIEHYDELGISGGIIIVGGKCIAYTLGERLNKETLVIHIEKAHIEYEGAYQAINNLFLKEFGEDIKYVNREQDIGIPGLRKAKEAYKPIHMVKKSVIFR